MNILGLDLHNYDSNFFYYLDTKKNLIMDGIFTKIIYTHSHFTMNGLTFSFPLQYTFYETTSENSFYMHFDPTLDSNRALIEIVLKLETQIMLHYASFMNKKKSSNVSLYKQLQKGKIKINGSTTFLQSHAQCVLKISGVWENDNEYGVTYKWLLAKPLL